MQYSQLHHIILLFNMYLNEPYSIVRIYIFKVTLNGSYIVNDEIVAGMDCRTGVVARKCLNEPYIDSLLYWGY